ncbi:MAG: glycosyltransferase family 4 protein [Bacteroidia bacterium]|nr:glycosyltransferase family 4 protein [Bacteroidia bacterium]MDW8235709.1 glycosyltransferase family 4 protein [Bacteroidia bacterium]
MRLLQLTNKFPFPPKDGGTLAMAFFPEAWRDLGYTGYGLAMDTPKHPFQPSYPTPIPYEAIPVHSTPTLPGAFLNLFSSLPYHVVRFQSRAYTYALQRIIETFQPDLIQVETPYLTPYIEGLSLPRIYRLHNVEWEIWLQHSQERAWPLRFYLQTQAKRIRSFEEKAIHRYQGLLPISKNEYQWIHSQRYKGSVELIPFAVRVDEYEVPPLGKPHPSIGYIGSLDWMPNQSGLVWFLEQVWPAFRRKHPTAHLYIAGRGMPAWMRKYQDNHTHLVGAIEDAKAFFYQHEIFIVPLFSGSGIRVKLIEAFATGRAIVATPLAADSLIYESGKHLLLAEKPEDFQQALSLLYTDAALRKQMGEATRHLAETTYDRSLVLEKMHHFYKEVLRHA